MGIPINVISSDAPVRSGEHVRYVSGLLHDRKKVSMWTKSPHVFGHVKETEVGLERDGFSGVDNADFYMDIWQKMKHAGLPVVTTVRKVSSETVIMTDLTADGSVIYGKHQASTVRFNESIDMQNKIARDHGWVKTQEKIESIDNRLMHVDQDRVEQLATEIMDTATQAGFTLPFDDPMVLVVGSDLTTRIYILDLSSTKMNDSPLAIKTDNYMSVQKFLHQISQIRKYLLGETVRVISQ